jgi:hypothetical protein
MREKDHIFGIEREWIRWQEKYRRSHMDKNKGSKTHHSQHVETHKKDRADFK